MRGLSTSINCAANLPAAEALEKHCKFNVEKVNDQSWFLYPHKWFGLAMTYFPKFYQDVKLIVKHCFEFSGVKDHKETTKTTVTQFHVKILCSIKKTMFGNVFYWYSTPWIILEPQVEHKSLKSVFLGSKAEAPTCGCFEGTSTSLRVPGDAKMVLEWAIKLKNRVINQERMFSTDIQPCGSS